MQVADGTRPISSALFPVVGALSLVALIFEVSLSLLLPKSGVNLIGHNSLKVICVRTPKNGPLYVSGQVVAKALPDNTTASE